MFFHMSLLPYLCMPLVIELKLHRMVQKVTKTQNSLSRIRHFVSPEIKEFVNGLTNKMKAL